MGMGLVELLTTGQGIAAVAETDAVAAGTFSALFAEVVAGGATPEGWGEANVDFIPTSAEAGAEPSEEVSSTKTGLSSPPAEPKGRRKGVPPFLREEWVPPAAAAAGLGRWTELSGPSGGRFGEAPQPDEAAPTEGRDVRWVQVSQAPGHRPESFPSPLGLQKRGLNPFRGEEPTPFPARAEPLAANAVEELQGARGAGSGDEVKRRSEDELATPGRTAELRGSVSPTAAPHESNPSTPPVSVLVSLARDAERTTPRATAAPQASVEGGGWARALGRVAGPASDAEVKVPGRALGRAAGPVSQGEAERPGSPVEEDAETRSLQNLAGGRELEAGRAAKEVVAPSPDRAGAPGDSLEVLSAAERKKTEVSASETGTLQRDTEGDPASHHKAKPVGAGGPGVERLWGYWLRRERAPKGVSEAGAEKRTPADPVDATAPSPRAAEPKEAVSSSSRRELRDADLLRPAPRASESSELRQGEPLFSRREDVPGTAPAVPEASRAPVDSGETGAPGSHVAEVVRAAEPAPRGATEPVRSPVHPSDVATPAEQVSKVLRLSFSPKGDRVTVDLEPERLGKVHLVLTRESHGLVANFRVETPEAHSALTAEAPLLQRELEAQGIPLVRVSVDLEGQTQERKESRDGRRASKRPSLGPVRDTGVLSEAGTARRTWGFETTA